MSIRRPFVKTETHTDAAPDATVQRVRFRHRLDRDDVIDLKVAPESDPAPRPLDRAARRAAKVAQAGYGLCLAAVSAPRTPTWSRAA